MSRSRLRYDLFLIPLVLAAFALSPMAQAQLSPPPDGGYPGNNTAEGTDALFSLTTGTDNTAMGFEALYSNTTGDSNTATGSAALVSNTTGIRNTANGFAALQSNTTGDNNTGYGYSALLNNTTGGGNIALGNFAGSNLTTGDNNIDIGNQGAAAEANTIRIGTQGTQTKTFIAGIIGAGVTGVAVKINAAGQLGTAPSSARFKQNIRLMDKASEAIHALKPVTFRYNQEIDPEGVPQFGLVAEDVAKANPDLVVRDEKGEVYTVRYDAVNAMLLNEFLKAYRKIQEQDATIAHLKQDSAEQRRQIQALTAGLQRVSDQLELRKPAPQMVATDQ
jgi:hypothetical protein